MLIMILLIACLCLSTILLYFLVNRASNSFDMTSNYPLLLPQKLKKARVSSGYSINEISDFSHISKDRIEKWEKGTSEPTLSELSSISKTFDINIDDFIEEFKE